MIIKLLPIKYKRGHLRNDEIFATEWCTKDTIIDRIKYFLFEIHTDYLLVRINDDVFTIYPSDYSKNKYVKSKIEYHPRLNEICKCSYVSCPCVPTIGSTIGVNTQTIMAGINNYQVANQQ